MGRYDVDAVVRAVAITSARPWRIFIGDTLGFVQILSLRDFSGCSRVRAPRLPP
jgi:hypothetical protein